jgi:hypothetical protein
MCCLQPHKNRIGPDDALLLLLVCPQQLVLQLLRVILSLIQLQAHDGI